jgi:Subtilase family
MPRKPAQSRQQRSSGARASRSRESSPGGMPDVIYAQASARSIGGVSLFDAGDAIRAETAVNFTSEDHLVRAAAARLRSAGFEVLHLSPTTINIAGPPKLYEQVFNRSLTTEERLVRKGGGVEDTATFVECPETELPGLIDTAGSHLEDVIEGVAIEEPRYLHQNPFAPTEDYWHLTVPGDVSLGTNADKAHRAGLTGLGIKVVQVDTGWFSHPYFTGRGYRASPVVLGPATANPNDDEVGHGTAESANVFAVAPDVDYTMVKMNFVNTIGAFNAAIALAPHIITCSWGSSNQFGPLSAADQALAAAIALAVANGIIVVFSAGNGHWGFPGQHPDVISAGGSYMTPDGNFTASNYASGFQSNIYPGRIVPDVCGLVGLLPRAAYIMLPLQPGDQIDVDLATSGAWPNGDNTANNDGWAAISGTSAAAPQTAGVCALVKQACARLTPAEVRDILRSTARDVTTGNASASTGGNAAGPGVDLATGSGLVDGQRAALVARVRCLSPIRPIVPVRPPIGPVEPVSPVRPIQPITPVRPPVQPIEPVRPPIQPVLPPVEPVTPVQPPIAPPIEPGPAPPQPAPTSEAEAEGSQGLSAREAEAIEGMIRESDDPGFTA